MGGNFLYAGRCAAQALNDGRQNAIVSDDWEASFSDTAQSIVLWVNEVLSDQANGGFYASQDADYSLDDDGDYFTWTLNELRGVLPQSEARIMELHYDVEPDGEMHHNPEKNVLWISRDADGIAKTLGLDETSVRLGIAASKGKLLASRKTRQTRDRPRRSSA